MTETGSGWKIGLGDQISGSLNLVIEAKFLNFTQNGSAAINEIGTYGLLGFSWSL